MVEAFSAHRAEKTLADGIQAGRAWWDLHDLDTGTFGYGSESPSELVVVVPYEIPRRIAE
jgi:hypothetical protein